MDSRPRKRTLKDPDEDKEDEENPRDANLKILIPSSASGAILGKGGETIGELQSITRCKIQMSKFNDFYPGTSERVCIITGKPSGILRVLDFFRDKIRDKPDAGAFPAMDFDNKSLAQRESQIKILVPNSTAGMIIGKKGSLVRKIKEESGSFVQISQRAPDLKERVVTVIGSQECNRKAVQFILDLLLKDPNSSSCLNISYGSVKGLVANSHPSGSPFAEDLGNRKTREDPPTNVITPRLSDHLVLNSRDSRLEIDIGSSRKPSNLASMGNLVHRIGLSLIDRGYTERDVDEITKAMSVLASHGILVASDKEQNQTIPNENSIPPQIHPPIPSPPIMNIVPGFVSTFGDGIPVEGYHSTLENKERLPPSSCFWTSQREPIAPYSTLPLEEEELDIEINESMIGAVLGPSGKYIVDIQQFSGARIQISKKGTFSPGTRNRIVTISGSPNNITTAKILIEKKILDEEDRRDSAFF